MKVGSYIPSAHISGHFDFDFSFLTLNERLKTSGFKRLGNIWFNMVLFHFLFFIFYFFMIISILCIVLAKSLFIPTYI